MSRWIGEKCGEEIEEPFDACWKCGTSRTGVEDPSFGKAGDVPIDIWATEPARPEPPAVSLQQRVERLEKQNRHLRWIVAAVACLVGYFTYYEGKHLYNLMVHEQVRVGLSGADAVLLQQLRRFDCRRLRGAVWPVPVEGQTAGDSFAGVPIRFRPIATLTR